MVKVNDSLNQAQTLTLSTFTQKFDNQSRKDQSVKKVDLDNFTKALDAQGMGGLTANSGRTLDSIAAEMADLASKPATKAGGEKWAADMGELTNMVTDAGSSASAQGTIATLAKSVNENADANTYMKDLLKNQPGRDITKDYTKEYTAALASGDSGAIGTAMAHLAMAFRTQYPDAKDFNKYINDVTPEGSNASAVLQQVGWGKPAAAVASAPDPIVNSFA